ncbi:hypothetical protein NDU88_008223 [Pleurodeles waltl]|uniref:Uncharacterized protein n=1 Tax=Pleurodeles waltl TaxID=8319 RepID=A0AAV7PNK4_PLEWA|nr:hypothetical protein NDU88_008223 [Pleurodeles waltl]
MHPSQPTAAAPHDTRQEGRKSRLEDTRSPLPCGESGEAGGALKAPHPPPTLGRRIDGCVWTQEPSGDPRPPQKHRGERRKKSRPAARQKAGASSAGGEPPRE